MTETPIDLPVGLRWVKLVCRLGRLVTDSEADEDAYPDLIPVGGTLTLAASPNRVRIQAADGRWRSVEVAGRKYTIRGDGELVDNEGRVGVYIPDPASLLVEPQGYAITAAVKPTGGTEWRVTIGGTTGLPDVVDLVAVSSVGSVSPSVTASFDARLNALETGGGVDVSQVVEDYLVANPPTGGSGVEEVSGVVTLESTGPRLRQFYTVGAVTIGDELFPIDTALVARRTDAGVWEVAVVESADWRAFEPPVATPLVPTFADPSGTADDEYTIPAVTGVIYKVNGVTTAAGTYSGSGTVTVTAEPEPGWTLTGTTTWTHTFSGGVEVTATAPTWTNDTANGGGTWTTPTITGVTYSPASGTADPGESVTVTASADSGYTLIGTTSWTHTFPAGGYTGPTLAEAIMALSPAGYWKLDETTGTVAVDSSGNNRPGTYTGTHTLTGSGVELDGGYVNIGDDDDWSVAGSTGFSVFSLALLDAQSSKRQMLASKGAMNLFEWQIEAPSNGLRIYTGVTTDKGGPLMEERTAVDSFSAAEMHALAVAMPAPAYQARFDVYIDSGTATASVPNTGVEGEFKNGTAPLQIGGRSGVDTWMGKVAHVAIFRTQLTATQVGALVDAARGEGLIA